MGEEVTTDQLSCVLATISYPLHSIGTFCDTCNSGHYHIMGNFRGENFHEFRGFMAICESFLRKIWASFGTVKASNL